MNIREHRSVAERRKAVEENLHLDLHHISNFSIDEHLASTKNCENMIGVLQVPIGIAGPLTIKNYELQIKNFYIPLATTEGALVASVNRGCKAVTESGGVT